MSNINTEFIDVIGKAERILQVCTSVMILFLTSLKFSCILLWPPTRGGEADRRLRGTGGEG
jgi:hypothetical protein